MGKEEEEKFVDGQESNPIDAIKQSLRENRMSVLVGSGFSKNAHQDFPSWEELLTELILEIYPYTSKKTDKEHKRKHISNIIKENGYLNLVDKYIKIKGRREAIDIYIENQFEKVNNKEKSFDPSCHKELCQINWTNIFTTNYDTLLEDHQEKFRVVTHRNDLVSGPTGKIIKIHGSLRENKNSEYGFDGDKFCHYIISSDDYRSYNQKHEIFAGLVKMSLIQEAFCLIGFSADDPNFNQWVEWVRETIDVKEKKIYFIYLDNNEINDEKELFLNNRGVIPVFLKKYYPPKENIVPNGNHTDSESEYKNYLRSFFKDLVTVTEQGYKVFDEVTPKLQDIFSSVLTTSKKLDEKEINKYKTIYEDLIKLDLHRGFNKYYPICFWVSEDFFTSLLQLGSKKNPFWLWGMMGLLSRIIFLPLQYCLKDKFQDIINEFLAKEIPDDSDEQRDYIIFLKAVISSIRIENDIKNFEEIDTKIAGLTRKEEKYQAELSDLINYEKGLFYGINFKTEELRKHLNNWKIKNKMSKEYYIKKYFLLRNFDNKKSVDLLKQAKDIGNDEKTEALFYGIMSLDIFFDRTEGEETEKKIKELRLKGYPSLYDIERNFYPDTGKDAEHGDKTIYRKRYSYSSNEKVIRSLQIHTYLLEFGIPLVGWKRVAIRSNNWKNYFDEIFSYFYLPNLSLFIAYQYKASQDLIKLCVDNIVINQNIDKKIKDDLFDNISKSFLFKLYSDLSYDIDLFTISRLSLIIDTDKIDNFLNDFWKIALEKDLLNTESIILDRYRWREPFTILLKKISRQSLIEEMIDKFISIICETEQTELEQGCIIFLEILLNKTKDLEKSEEYVKKILDKTNGHDNHYYLFSKLEEYMSKDVKARVVDKLKSNINKPVRNIVYLVFFKDNQETLKTIRRQFIQKKILFSSGIKNGTWSISSFNQYYYKNILKNKFTTWEKEEIKELFQQVEEEIDKIELFNKPRAQFNINSFHDHLILMYWFLMTYNTFLQDEAKYQEVKNKVITELKMLGITIKKNDLINNLLSNDENKVLDNVNFFFIYLYDFPADDELELEKIWLVFCSKILNKKPPKIEESIGYLVDVITGKYDVIDWIKNYQFLYIEILRIYQKMFEENKLEEKYQFYFIFIHEHFQKLAKFLIDRGEMDETLSFWEKELSEIVHPN